MAFSLFESKENIFKALSKTRKDLGHNLSYLFQPSTKIDESLWQDLEDLLISADTGIETTAKLIAKIKTSAQKQNIDTSMEIMGLLKSELLCLMNPYQEPYLEEFFTDPSCPKPLVIMVVGVNGVGKTTSVAKLAAYYQRMGKNITLGAGDTFRAAAIDQLKVWGERLNLDVVAHQQGSDPGAIAFDAYNAAIARQADVLIYDTAGRLHNKNHLMDELSKINRVFGRISSGAPHQILLVLDATTGQNGLEQARSFQRIVDINAIFLTKLDSTAKGGIVIAINDQLGIPVALVGTGEQVNDLSIFDRNNFIDGLFDEN